MNRLSIKSWLPSVIFIRQTVPTYLKRDRSRIDYWNNTFEWCNSDVEPQINNLQGVAPQVVKRWLLQFEQDQTIFIYNIAPLKQTAPEEW